MNYLTITIGILPIIYGIFVIILRLSGKDEMFRKLKPMKEKFGKKAGNIIHIIGYVLTPIGVGTAVIYFGVNGLSLLEIFNR